MVARGRVENGVVVLADGIHLPEGQWVTVLTSAPSISAETPDGLGASSRKQESAPISKERQTACDN